jgi:hypothetical protein
LNVFVRVFVIDGDKVPRDEIRPNCSHTDGLDALLLRPVQRVHQQSRLHVSINTGNGHRQAPSPQL